MNNDDNRTAPALTPAERQAIALERIAAVAEAALAAWVNSLEPGNPRDVYRDAKHAAVMVIGDRAKSGTDSGNLVDRIEKMIPGLTPQ